MKLTRAEKTIQNLISAGARCFKVAAKSQDADARKAVATWNAAAKAWNKLVKRAKVERELAF